MEALPQLMQEAMATISRFGGVERLLDHTSDPVWSGMNTEAAFQAGMVDGAAAALDLTVAELFDELGLG